MLLNFKYPFALLVILIILSGIIVFFIYNKLFPNKKTIEGFQEIPGLEQLLLNMIGRLVPDKTPTPPTPDSKKYNIDVGGRPKAYDIKDMLLDKKKIPTDIRTAELLTVQFHIRQALISAARDVIEITREKQEQAKKNFERSVKIQEFLTKVSLSDYKELSREALKLQIKEAEEIKLIQTEIEVSTREFSNSNDVFKKMTTLFRVSGEHELSQKVFNPYGGDPANAKKKEACDKLEPIP